MKSLKKKDIRIAIIGCGNIANFHTIKKNPIFKLYGSFDQKVTFTRPSIPKEFYHELKSYIIT